MNAGNDSITIGTITIHQSENGLYSLRDLWVAGGKRKSKQASDWLKLKSTQEIINELLAEKVGVLFSQQVIEVVDGSPEFGGGTYACEELCNAYAMWLNPKFYVLVVRTFINVHRATTAQHLIDIKAALDNQQMDFMYREPRDPNTLQVHLKIASSKLRPYFQWLISKGELTEDRVPQPDKIIYKATENAKTVIGHKGHTVLFNESVVDLFPAQIDWCE